MADRVGGLLSKKFSCHAHPCGPTVCPAGSAHWPIYLLLCNLLGLDVTGPTWPSALDSGPVVEPGSSEGGAGGGDHATLQGKEPSYLERLEQLQAVLSGYLEKVGGARPGGGRVLGGRAGAAPPPRPVLCRTC